MVTKQSHKDTEIHPKEQWMLLLFIWKINLSLDLTLHFGTSILFQLNYLAVFNMKYVYRTQVCHISSRTTVQPHQPPIDLAMLVCWPAMPLHSFSFSWLQFTWQVFGAYSSSLCKADPWGISIFHKKRSWLSLQSWLLCLFWHISL